MNRLLTFVSLALSMALLGCGPGDIKTPGMSDPTVAKQSLTKALDAWKSGQQPNSLDGITVNDFDWHGGAKLASYAIQADGVAFGESVSFRATLDMTDAKGARQRVAAQYLVATTPKISISRSDDPDAPGGSSSPGVTSSAPGPGPGFAPAPGPSPSNNNAPTD